MDHEFEGLNVDFWAPVQTLHPQKDGCYQRYTGFMTLGLDWWDFAPAIPLHLRYASFKRRLAERLAR